MISLPRASAMDVCHEPFVNDVGHPHISNT